MSEAQSGRENPEREDALQEGSPGELAEGAEGAEGQYTSSEEIPEEERHLKTKQIPALVMLSAGSVTAIRCFLRHDDLLYSLASILISLVVFLVAGEIVKLMLDHIEIQKKLKKTRDAVIERPQEDGTRGTEEAVGN